MNWFSKCVCGNKKKNKSKKKLKKKKLRDDIYAINDSDNKTENLDENLNLKIQNNDSIIEIKKNVINNNLHDDVNATECSNNNEVEFYDSLSDASPTGTINKLTNKNKINIDENKAIIVDKNINKLSLSSADESIDNTKIISVNNSTNSALNDNKLQYINNKKQIDNVDEKNLKFGKNSCSFLIQLDGVNKKQINNKKKINSMIPKPSINNNFKKKQNGI